MNRKVSQKLLPPKQSLPNAQQVQKKNEAKKAKREGRRETKSESRKCCATFKPKNYVEILFSAHARTLQALILHLVEKAAECTTWERACREI